MTGPEVRSPQPSEQTVWQHLEELRKRLFVALGAVGAASVAGYFVSDRLVEWLVRPLAGVGSAVYFFSPQGALVVKIKAALLAGILLASPVVCHQLWSFLSPGLYRHEKRLVLPLALVAAGFFLAGAAFACWVVLPAAVTVLVGMQTETLRPMISVEEYLSFVTSMVLAFGVAFNLPVAVLGLTSMGALTPAALWRGQRHVILAIFVAAAVLTPGPDIASQLLLAGPLVLLYELSMGLAFLIAPRAAGAGGRARSAP